MPRDVARLAAVEPILAEHLKRVNIARFWNYAGQGKDNFARDRAVVDAIARQGFPVLPTLAHDNHRFLLRAAGYLAHEQRISQFLVLGPGLPADAIYLHDTVQAFTPSAKVLYVDNDPVVLAHAWHGISSARCAQVVEADIFDPKSLLDRKEVTTFLDWSAPIAIICTAALHYHPGDTADVAGVMQTYIDAAAEGTCTAISHFLDPGLEGFDVRGLEAALSTELEVPVQFRTIGQIEELFPDQELLAPGAVSCVHWPEPDENAPGAVLTCIAGGIGRKNSSDR
ncbi:MAG TPA: SAM-dependent methyltransferase [Kribbella sp.]